MTGSLRPAQAATVVVLLTCLAYLNSFGGTFVFDDIGEIYGNPAMEQLFPPWEAMFKGVKARAPAPALSDLRHRHPPLGTDPVRISRHEACWCT